MTAQFYSNMTRLFVRPSAMGPIVAPPRRSQGWRWLPRVGIWRVLWNGGRQRVILVELMSDSTFLPHVSEYELHDFLLLGGLCSDPSDPDQGDDIIQIIGANRHRAWMPRPSALRANDADVLDFWMEFRCSIVAVKGGEDD